MSGDMPFTGIVGQKKQQSISRGGDGAAFFVQLDGKGQGVSRVERVPAKEDAICGTVACQPGLSGTGACRGQCLVQNEKIGNNIKIFITK